MDEESGYWIFLSQVGLGVFLYYKRKKKRVSFCQIKNLFQRYDNYYIEMQIICNFLVLKIKMSQKINNKVLFFYQVQRMMTHHIYNN